MGCAGLQQRPQVPARGQRGGALLGVRVSLHHQGMTITPQRFPFLRNGGALVLLSSAWLLAACQPKVAQPIKVDAGQQQRLNQLELKVQQLEQKLNATTPRDPADRDGKPPAGPVKSLTLRSGSDDDRLRIYWADGSSSDLPCTKEQSTLVCG